MNLPNSTEPNGITISAMKDLLRYLYTGSDKHITDPLNCLYILCVAEFYLNASDSHSLMIHCSYIVQNSITVETCLDLFQLVFRLRVAKFEEILIQFILMHYKEVAEKLPLLPLHIFQHIQVAFNLKLLSKYGSF